MNQTTRPDKENDAFDSGTVRGINVHWEFADSGNQYAELDQNLSLLVHHTGFSHGHFRWDKDTAFQSEFRSTPALLSASTDDLGLPVDQHGSRLESIHVDILYIERDRRAVPPSVDTGVEFAISVTRPSTNDAWIDQIEQELVTGRAKHPLVIDFERGVQNEPMPSPNSVSMAQWLVESAESNAKETEISVDVDGGMSFTIVANDGTLISGEYTAKGELYAWHYESDWSTQRAEIIGERDISNLIGWLG